MSLKVQTGQAQDITSRWELAQRLFLHAETPQNVLQAVFTYAIQQLETIAKTKFKSPMHEKVWNRVYGDKLKALRETFILEICDRIIGNFNEKEVKAMLEEYRKMGAVKNQTYIFLLQITFVASQSSIIDSVKKKAISMTQDWIPEIIDALKSDGIELPDPINIKTIADSVLSIVIPCNSPEVTAQMIQRLGKVSLLEAAIQ